jgi:hypothetical protein
LINFIGNKKRTPGNAIGIALNNNSEGKSSNKSNIATVVNATGQNGEKIKVKMHVEIMQQSKSLIFPHLLCASAGENQNGNGGGGDNKMKLKDQLFEEQKHYTASFNGKPQPNPS